MLPPRDEVRIVFNGSHWNRDSHHRFRSNLPVTFRSRFAEIAIGREGVDATTLEHNLRFRGKNRSSLYLQPARCFAVGLVDTPGIGLDIRGTVFSLVVSAEADEMERQHYPEDGQSRDYEQSARQFRKTAARALPHALQVP